MGRVKRWEITVAGRAKLVLLLDGQSPYAWLALGIVRPLHVRASRTMTALTTFLHDLGCVHARVPDLDERLLYIFVASDAHLVPYVGIVGLREPALGCRTCERGYDPNGANQQRVPHDGLQRACSDGLYHT